MKAKDLIIGDEYECRSARKGVFRMRVDKVDGEWVTGTITNGVATAMMAYNVRDEGEQVTVRDSLSYFTPLRPQPPKGDAR